ncbi:MAG TPA: pitrilysin family protein [Armatimonadota bacterium]
MVSMSRRGATATFAGLGAVAALCVSTAAAPRARQTAGPAAAKAAPRLVLKKVRFEDYRLRNGLRVLLSEDPSAPMVAIAVGYHVGGKDDPPGRSGFAHLFEHLMFKGTANLPPESMDRFTEDVGGANNAFTQPDSTVYHEVIPSNYLRRLLWAEADRLASLKVDAANFKTEREVVIGEYEQNVVASPYGRLWDLLQAKAFVKHPYGLGVIGNPANLRAATLKDVRAFHATYYVPQNAVLAVVGNFHTAQARQWVQQYFGRVAPGPRPIPRVRVVEPPQRAPRTVLYHGANVPLPAVALAYHIPAASQHDADVLDVASAILSGGESSRLHQKLVYSQQIAFEVGADADTREQPGLFVITAMLNRGKSPEAALGSLRDEISRLRTSLATPDEIARAKTQLLTHIVRSRERSEDRATELVETSILEGDPGRVNTAAERLQSVTPEEIRAAARKYLTPTNVTVMRYLPAAKPLPAAPDAKGKGQ